jgi:hypothetical protein
MKQQVIINVLACAMAILIALILRPATSPPPSHPIYVMGESISFLPNNEKPLAIKNEPRTVDLKNVTLETAIEKLKVLYDVNLVADWQILESAGIDKTTRITLQLRDVSLSAALDQLCRCAGGAPQTAYYVKNGMVVLATTTEQKQHNLVMRIYDIHDILMKLAGREYQIITLWQFQIRPAAQQELTDKMTNLIMQSVDPDSWKEYGQARIREINGLLVINQTPETHLKIQAFLDQLRKTLQ